MLLIYMVISNYSVDMFLLIHHGNTSLQISLLALTLLTLFEYIWGLLDMNIFMLIEIV